MIVLLHLCTSIPGGAYVPHLAIKKDGFYFKALL
jgi:hypothetical protein